MNAILNEQAQDDGEMMSFFVELINSGDLIAVLRPDGQLGWRPAPPPADDVTRICRLCAGTGFLEPAIAALVTPDFRLDNMCPACHGTGIDIEVNEVTPTADLPYRFDPESIDEVPF